MRDELQAALMDIAGMLNSPRYDDLLLTEAGVALDRALFPLLVRIDALGPLGVTELAEQVGRDHSTVSRQVAKLESLGFVRREGVAGDQRVRAAVVTDAGRQVAQVLAAARNRLFARLLADWSAADRAALTRLNGRLAGAMHRLGAEALAEATSRDRGRNA
ncbi:MAG: MarR family transcriptional regulator [Rhodobacteraceae bacterium]|nr:MarR family transcriptional regulator [Paracoccaceae bacterium]